MKRSLLLALVLPLTLHAQMIRGRIVDADAKPVAGAQVQVMLAERSAFEFFHAPAVKTADDGRYEIAAPPFDETQHAALAVTLPAHATVRSKPFQVVAGDLAIDVTLPRFDMVTVHVTDPKGKPLPDARVAFATSEDTMALRTLATLLMEHFAVRNVLTNEHGDAVLHLLPGTWDFAAIAEDFQPATIAERTIKRETSIAIALEPAVAIRGRVHRDGAGVANANVVILQGERHSRDERPIITKADGTFEIRGLSPGPYRVIVTQEEEMVRRIMETRAPATLDVALPPAGTLRSRIIDADTQRPVREFFYSIESVDSPDTNTHQRGVSAEDGTATNTLTTGTYRVLASAPGYTMTRPVEVRVTENEPAEITIALDRGITITGRVSDDENAPVADAAIFVETPDMRERRVGPGNARTAADGTFSISGIEPGNASLVVRKDGFVPFRKPLTLDATATVDVQLTRGLSIEGVVRRGGKPVAGAQISADTAGLGGAQQSTQSDANGRFVLRGLVPARYSIAAFTDDANTSIHDVDPTKTRELVLSLDPKPTGILHGIVTGIPTLGGKVTRRVVFVQSPDRGVEGMIDDAGNYRIEDVPAGTVFVTAQLESTQGGRSSERKSIEVIPGQTQRLDLDLGGAYTVRGRVTHDGKPLAGVRVAFANDTGLAASAASRADGAYEVALPIAGRYQIFAHSETLATGNIQLVREIRGGETIDIELREQTIEGTVIDAATREPLRGVSVTIAPETAPAGWYAGEVSTDTNGRFRILTAAIGTYRVIAWTRGYAQRAQLIQLGTTPPPPLAFELTPTTDVLRIRVLDARSATPLNAHVTISSPDNTYLPIRCDRDEDGLTMLCSLAPGKYRLNVVVQGYKDRALEVTAPG
ncbi:MAG: carboxypeptidase regulatory-like domain-containing protein, partial [Thermoanaerobaculia bacterium]